MNRLSRCAALLAGLAAVALAAPGAANAGGVRVHYAFGFHAGHGGGHHRHHHGVHLRHHGYLPWAGLTYLLVAPLLYSTFAHEPRRYRYLAPTYRARPAPARAVASRAVRRRAPRGRVCLQQREYQTVLTIDGQQISAYGTACLQPDGSWRLGPARRAR